jgi:formylglycine-generating enzyme required for sulfatase activity
LLGFGSDQFIQIQAGSFQIGSSTGAADEQPVHPVIITRPFYLQKTELTQGQWNAVMGENPSHFDDCGESCPVEMVSWDDIQEFLRRLNEMDPGMGYRLPTEAEWEYAARAGTGGDYGGTGRQDDMGWYFGNQTHPVGQKQPNAWGLYDMHGNVWEWVQDRYSKTYYGESTTSDPLGPATGTGIRVLRGGAWNSGPGFTRSAIRFFSGPSARAINYGFRLARSR